MSKMGIRESNQRQSVARFTAQQLAWFYQGVVTRGMQYYHDGKWIDAAFYPNGEPYPPPDGNHPIGPSIGTSKKYWRLTPDKESD